MDSPRSPFDKPMAIAVAIAVAAVGSSVFMGLPILVGALVDYRSFTEEQVGYLASADLGGMLVSSVLVALYVTRADRRIWIAIGVLLAVAANVASIYSYDLRSMLVIRMVSGIGGGFCYSIALANLASSVKSARNFSYLISALVATNFVELYLLELISSRWGVNGIFFTFATINLLCLLGVKHLPRGRDELREVLADLGAATEDDESPKDKKALPYNLKLLGTFCLIAIAAFYVMVGAFWAYVERIGQNAGFSDKFVAFALSGTTLVSLAGCYLAYRLSRHQGQSKPLIVAPLGIAVVVIWLGHHTVGLTFVASLVIYQVLWNGVDIFQLGTLSNIDQSGRYIALVPAAQGVGQTSGPSIAGFLIGQGFQYDGVLNLCAAASLAASLVYAVVYFNLRRNAPQIADAR